MAKLRKSRPLHHHQRPQQQDLERCSVSRSQASSQAGPQHSALMIADDDDNDYDEEDYNKKKLSRHQKQLSSLSVTTRYYNLICFSGSFSALFWVVITLLVIGFPLWFNPLPSSEDSKYYKPMTIEAKAKRTKKTSTAPKKMITVSMTTVDVGKGFASSSATSSWMVHDPEAFERISSHNDIKDQQRQPDYGGLHIPEESTKTKKRNQNLSDYDRYNQYRTELIDKMDQKAKDVPLSYWYDEEKQDIHQECRSTSWAYASYPNCNIVHELPPFLDWENYDYTSHSTSSSVPVAEDTLEYNIKYLSSGGYRIVYKYDRSNSRRDSFVLKRMIPNVYEFTIQDISRIRKEAIVHEVLTSSPHIMNSFGYCGGSIMIESMSIDLNKVVIYGNGHYDQHKLDKIVDDTVDVTSSKSSIGSRPSKISLNNFTISQKLQMSLEMAESLASMHGYVNGQIIHSDVHIEQWLLDSQGNVKLNDFNRATLSKWNITATPEEQQEYCTRKYKFAGIYSSPEEFEGSTIDEKSDTYSMGNNIYVLLTGLWPFYTTQEQVDRKIRIRRHEKQVRERIIQGERPYVDPRFRKRSFIEGKLVEIMEKCWVHDRTKRVDIFFVVSFLREVKRQAIERGDFDPTRFTGPARLT